MSPIGRSVPVMSREDSKRHGCAHRLGGLPLFSFKDMTRLSPRFIIDQHHLPPLFPIHF